MKKKFEQWYIELLGMPDDTIIDFCSEAKEFLAGIFAITGIFISIYLLLAFLP